MDDFFVAFTIVTQRNCPFYEAEDLFVLSNRAVHLPLGHPSCLILVREVTNLLFSTIVPAVGNGIEELQNKTFSCGGCTGLIKFQIEADQERVDQHLAAFQEKEDRAADSDADESLPQDGVNGVGVSGQLSEVSPSELLQFFHMHQKTGKLVLDVAKGTGKVAFREGAIIRAEFLEHANKEAVFTLMREHHGQFSFVSGISDDMLAVEDIGDFMMILMEGIKRMDEEEG